jgi:hypothetical protein
MTMTLRRRLTQAAGIAAALAVLGGVFMLYTRPAFMVALIDQFWSCF